jgi:hypothetical protein
MTNPFSKDYVPKVKIDHWDRKYKKPVLNQPPKNSRVNLNEPTFKASHLETFGPATDSRLS